MLVLRKGVLRTFSFKFANLNCSLRMEHSASIINAEDKTDLYHNCFNPNLLRGNVAFVTGGGSGIGYSITEVLMRHGCKTVIASRNKEKLEKAANSLKQLTAQDCYPLVMDVRKPDQIMSAVDSALGRFGRIDFLINNSAGNFLCPASNMSFNAFKTVMEIDAQGTFNVSKVLFDKYMKDHGGVIVNISATLQLRGVPFQAHASSAKAAVDTLTKCLAVEWGRLGIRVVGVAPGPTGDTEGLNRLGKAGNMQYETSQNIPLGKIGNKLDIGYSILYLLSPVASYITGHTMVVDGGDWMTSNHFGLMKPNSNL
ncbi:Peroxisomal 2,4-dienoyl-CoA reductase [Holothuria leucospilota]|uniref:Peroxisomal 2,4-dienoyl-CoA reductase [(3E)-enoyl-CoA-producing] n=1 Tax=Holothuria leucospilota TaxID=206669 RepID=A0A9Q1H941_HOLLE|nr:Peroxisomal 2,4-dienoyl-CoA reductase [Holothuria leucospilota]